ncbi:MAG TPA: MYXO-CTERM sorting domain-containing protein, partial [Polyangia bacterium]|nr:MYXO-CTERM sorting domain-containing protein [Polyangia bacterium]
GTGGLTASGGTTGNGSGGAMSSGSGGAMSSGSGGAPTTGTGGAVPPGDISDGGGCACAVEHGESGAAGLLALASALSIARRRRRSR